MIYNQIRKNWMLLIYLVVINIINIIDYKSNNEFSTCKREGNEICVGRLQNREEENQGRFDV